MKRLSIAVLLFWSSLLHQLPLLQEASQVFAAEKQKPSGETKKPKITGETYYPPSAEIQKEETSRAVTLNANLGQSSSTLPRNGAVGFPLVEALLILANVLLLVLVGEKFFALLRAGKESTETSIDTLAKEQTAQRLEVRHIAEILELISQGTQSIQDQIDQLRLQIGGPLLHPKEPPNQELAHVSASLNKLIANIERLPIHLKTQISEELDYRERARKEEELRKRNQIIHNELMARANELSTTFPIINIASLTRKLLTSLRFQLKDWEALEKTFADYLNLDKKWVDLCNLQSKLKDNSLETQSVVPEQLNMQIEDTRDFSEALTKKHRSVWFTTILDATSRLSAEQETVRQLKDLLNIEEISLAPGQDIKNPRDFEVVGGVEGSGNRTVVKEVLQNGYQERTSGVVIKKPKVSVRLE